MQSPQVSCYGTRKRQGTRWFTVTFTQPHCIVLLGHLPSGCAGVVQQLRNARMTHRNNNSNFDVQDVFQCVYDTRVVKIHNTVFLQSYRYDIGMSVSYSVCKVHTAFHIRGNRWRETNRRSMHMNC
jgi:hypothetical protein